MTTHTFTAQSLNICFNHASVDQWLEDNQIPHHKDVSHQDIYYLSMANNISAKLSDHQINSLLKHGLTGPKYIVTDLGHTHAIHQPLLVYTLIDDESAILFKLQFGDYFDHEVKEQE
jgi:hypothetical protein